MQSPQRKKVRHQPDYPALPFRNNRTKKTVAVMLVHSLTLFTGIALVVMNESGSTENSVGIVLAGIGILLPISAFFFPSSKCTVCEGKILLDREGLQHNKDLYKLCTCQDCGEKFIYFKSKVRHEANIN